MVVSSTEDIEGQRQIVEVAAAAAPGQIVTTQVPALDVAENEGEGHDDEDGEGPYLVAVARTGGASGSVAVVAAGSLGAVDRTTRTLAPLIAFGVPVITLLVGLTVWRLARRAFRPVEAMAEQAEVISYSDLHLRVPVPDPDDEVRHLAVVLNRMLDRVEVSASRQRRFTADAGHELKSPVASLLTMAEVAEANPHAFTVADFAGDVAIQSRRLRALVEDLLILARTDEHQLELDREPFDLQSVVRDEIMASEPPGVSFDSDRVQPAWVLGDRRRIGQVVRNLLDNAVRHAAHTVRIETHAGEGTVTMLVADDGPGIPRASRSRVFERFVRLDESRARPAGGTGLGLSVVKSIVEAHGGRVAIDEDAELGGVAMIVVLPAAHSPTKR